MLLFIYYIKLAIIPFFFVEGQVSLKVLMSLESFAADVTLKVPHVKMCLTHMSLTVGRLREGTVTDLTPNGLKT